MKRPIQRKCTPGVSNGRVKKKNNWDPSHCFCGRSVWECIIRKRPGKGYRHLLSRSQVWEFLHLLPDRTNLLHGLQAVVLGPGEPSMFGYHAPGIITICAWPENLWLALSPDGYAQEREYLERLNVSCEKIPNGMLCKFTEESARAHQLLVTLVHEIGHHRDRMTTRSQKQACRGEPYAENYVRRYADELWRSYDETFGLP